MSPISAEEQSQGKVSVHISCIGSKFSRPVSISISSLALNVTFCAKWTVAELEESIVIGLPETSRANADVTCIVEIEDSF